MKVGEASQSGIGDGGVDEFIADTVSRLRKGLTPDAIYLFGSHARGDTTPDSDVDFLVVIRNSSLPRHRRSQLARAVAANTSFSKDIVVLTREEWERGLRIPVSLASTVQREGRRLYER